MRQKKRLDQIFQDRHPEFSKTQIQSWIMQGKVKVNEQIITKPGTMVDIDVSLSYDIEKPKYVSRAGFKLEAALDYFNIDVHGLTALDAGISTGGFTDCLLQKGAKRVYGIDVGYGQVHEKIKDDARVVLKERTNLRYLTDLGELMDLVTLDLSFISILKVMEAINHLLKPNGKLIILIKPQFEVEKHEVGAKGIIKDPKIHARIIEQLTKKIEEFGYNFKGIIESPILGATGNKEFLAYFERKES